jgi:cyclophilin family peptidyl-prolyl cis-trans isomerase
MVLLCCLLQGRATLEMQVHCSETPEGPQDVQLVLVLDGYNAPVSAGQFMDLVNRKFYDGMEVQRADGFVVQTGKPDGSADGYVDPATGEIRRCVTGAWCG